MAKRSITDKEIALIKAMVRLGWKNKDIQFYFNRQDRPVNSGRITDINKGEYGPSRSIEPATKGQLDAFLSTFKPSDVGVVIKTSSEPAPSHMDEALSRFERRDDGAWHLINGDTAEQEAKAQFDPKRLTPIIGAIAAMANNKGGFIFIGVDDTGKVCGLSDSSFHNTDLARITDKTKTLLTPTPEFTKRVIRVGPHDVDIIQVSKHPRPPVIVCKDADKLRDGAILFRYPAQSSQIRFGDLLDMLRC